jgi:threonine aldolase
MVEFRSDTFTRPTAGMRAAMAAAEVGDDVWREDPTVRALEERAAAIVGKEAGLFVPSGAMGNAIGVRIGASHGEEIYAHETSHVVASEAGGPAALWGVTVRGLHAPAGLFDVAELERWIPGDQDDPHVARSRLVCIENTSMQGMGAPWPLDRLEAIAAAARGRGLTVHIDGARLFNAVVAQGVGADVICRHADTVTFCLSKGLGAPVGSVVCGSREAIALGLRLRKLLGGGMRQAGIIAAAGLYALEHHVERLADDHANARLLADGLAATARLAVDPALVQTNVVLAGLTRGADTAAGVCAELAAVGVLAAPYDDRTIRFVTCLEVDRAAVEGALSVAGPVLR